MQFSHDGSVSWHCMPQLGFWCIMYLGLRGSPLFSAFCSQNNLVATSNADLLIFWMIVQHRERLHRNDDLLQLLKILSRPCV
jgi:hypothetical protein